MVKVTPPQEARDIGVIMPAGLMVTVTVNGAAAPQLTVVGVTV